MELITILNKKVERMIYKGYPVMTFKQIDELHERPEGTAGRNFRENKERFLGNKDYFEIKGSELENLKLSTNFVETRTPLLVVISESGYLKITKSFKDDLSWKIQDLLVECYFKVKSSNAYTIPKSFSEALKLASELQKYIEDNQHKVDTYETIMNSEGLISIQDFAKATYKEFKLGSNQMFEFMRNHKYLYFKDDHNIVYQEYIDRGLFAMRESCYDKGDEKKRYFRVFLTQKGRDYFIVLLKNKLIK